MADGWQCVLVTPISPQQEGNGLAHRCRVWQDVLGRLGTVTTIVVPVSGLPHDGDRAVGLLPRGDADSALPPRAGRAPEHLGRAWRPSLEGTPDVVLALRADTGLFALGVAAGTGALVAIDLDDDDASLARALDDDEEARRYETLIDDLRQRADVLFSVTGFDGTVAVPNCVDVGLPARSPASDPPTLLMVGNFTYAPNVRGATWFLEEVLPLVQAAQPEVVLQLVGPGSEALGPAGLGFVQDLVPLYAQAAVAIVPLLEGSGSRLKALEAFARGVPVVGTTIGLSGLPAQHGVDCLMADTPQALADAVTAVLGDPDLAARLVAGAARTVAPLDRALVAAQAAERLRQLAADRPPPRYVRPPGLVEAPEDDGLVVVDEEAMVAHHLNPLAAAVFLLVDGPADAAGLAIELAELTGGTPLGLEPLVASTLSDLASAGLLLASQRPQAH